ncbi:MAG: ABC transporter substrate-binding protein [Dehalococcoidales bacterium]|nr:ABC transporter substrate-binding protein [Dehalococcoidales bacterium]
MKGKKLLLAIVCFVIISSLLAGFGLGCKGTTVSTTTATTTIKETKTLEIGCILGLTGVLAPNEVVGSRELDCYVDYVNENGGITVGDVQYLIKITIVDNQSTLDGTAAAANQLAYDKKVKFVLEPIGVLSVAGNSIFDENKIIHVCPYNTLTSGEFGPDTPYKFLGQAGMYGQLAGTLEGMKVNFPEVKNIVCIQPDNASKAVNALVNKLVPDMSLNLVDFIVFASDTIDFNPIATRINSVADIDAIVASGGTYNQTAAIIKALRGMGNQKPIIYNGTISGDRLVDMIGSEFSNNIMTVSMVEDPNNPPMINELIHRMQTKYNEAFAAGFNANCLYVLLQAIEKAQSLDTTVIRDTWESMTTIDSLYGKGTMGGLQTYGIKHAIVHPIPTQLIMNGEYTMGPWVQISIP